MTPLERFRDNHRLAMKILNRFCAERSLNRDEYWSIAMLGLWHACQRFEDRGLAFSSFAWPTIYGCLRSYRSKECRQLGYGRGRRHLPEPCVDRQAHYRCEPELDDAEIRDNIVAAAMKQLPIRDGKIIAMRFGLCGWTPHTVAQIGSRLRLSDARVYQLIYRSIRHLRLTMSEQAINDAMHVSHGPIYNRQTRIADDEQSFADVVRAYEEERSAVP